MISLAFPRGGNSIPSNLGVLDEFYSLVLLLKQFALICGGGILIPTTVGLAIPTIY